MPIDDFSGAVADPTTLGLCPTRLERVTQWLHQQVDGGRLAGAGVLIGRRGEVGYFETAGHADRESKTPFSRDTLSDCQVYSSVCRNQSLDGRRFRAR